MDQPRLLHFVGGDIGDRHFYTGNISDRYDEFFDHYPRFYAFDSLFWLYFYVHLVGFVFTFYNGDWSDHLWLVGSLAVVLG